MTVRPSARYVVLEHHTTGQVREAAIQLAGRDGPPPVAGWRPPARPPGQRAAGPFVCVGRVSTAADASAAVLAAVGGANLVVDVTGADRDVIDRLCDDLRRLGELDHRVEPPRDLPLDDVQRDLLALLMGGATLGQAARALHLSRRTADRRLAAARHALDASSTSEAVTAARRLGIEPVGLQPPQAGDRS